ncbi:MAG: ZPR1 zinc finger domain-containing protein [archaeon]
MVKKKEETEIQQPAEITGETCAFCHKKTLTLRESEMEVPFFGLVHLFSMDCSTCGYYKADIESNEQKEPSKFVLEIDCEDDMKIRIVKSSTATIKYGQLGSVEPGEASNGYITNVEGLLNRFKKQVEHLRDEAEDKEDRKKAKNMVKKLTRVMWGQEKLKLTIEDPSGNSAIISDKAKKEKLKKK